MSVNMHYELKDASIDLSYSDVIWLNSNNLKYEFDETKDSNEQHTCLLAKCESANGDIKLLGLNYKQLFENNDKYNYEILKLANGSYHWCQVNDISIPKHALRVGFDKKYRNFIFVGRLKADSLKHNNNNNNTSYNHQTFGGSNMSQYSIFGAVTNVCEYTSANFIQFTNLPTTITLDKSLLVSDNKEAIANNGDNKQQQLDSSQQQQQQYNVFGHDNNSNTCLTNDYEILCLKPSPSSLKQLCVAKILKLENEYYDKKFSFHSLFEDNLMVNKQNHLNKMPKLIHNLIWPSTLYMNHCLRKCQKLRSSNSLYELVITDTGICKFRKLFANKTCKYYKYRNYIHEKNIESLVICKYGVMLVYDYKQANRRPTILYEANLKNDFSSNFYLKLEDNGKLVVISGSDADDNDDDDMNNTQRTILFDLNDYFLYDNLTATTTEEKNTCTTTTTTQTHATNDDSNCNNSNNRAREYVYVPRKIEIASLNKYEKTAFKVLKCVVDSSMIPSKFFYYVYFMFKKGFSKLVDLL